MRLFEFGPDVGLWRFADVAATATTKPSTRSPIEVNRRRLSLAPGATNPGIGALLPPSIVQPTVAPASGAYRLRSERMVRVAPMTASALLTPVVTSSGPKIRFEVATTAGGRFVAFDFALSFPERLRSLVVADSLGGVRDKEVLGLESRIRPPARFRAQALTFERDDSGRTASFLRAAARDVIVDVIVA
jgi:hypothetical protein